jgi:TonB-dependent receptor
MVKIKQLIRGTLFLQFILCFNICQAQQNFGSIREIVTLHGQNISLVECFQQLEKQSRRVFTYSQPQLTDIRLSSINFEKQPLGVVLSFLEANAPIEISLIQGNIAIRRSNHPAHADKKGGGVLKGRIVDFETEQPLAGATVSLPILGRSVISNEKGYYLIQDVPPGEYILAITYTGYATATQKFSINTTAIIDVKMQVSSSLNEVVVTPGGRKVKAVTYSTEKDLINEIRFSTGVISGISNEMINKTGDRNAAEVVKRISGVTVVDDRFIVVRGMNERYNLTFLNNNVAPTTEMYNKAFAYDLLPSSIIDKIIVYKSPVADLVADYGGGAIKVYTKNAMPVRHLDIGVQVAHRPGSTLTDVNSYTGGKYDFLGFDDGSRKLPSWSPGYFQTEKRTTGVSQSDMLKGFSNNLDYGTMHSLPDMQVFLNYYNTWKLGGSIRLFDLTSVTFTHEVKSYPVYFQTGNTNAYLLDSYGSNSGDLNKISNDQQTTENGKINILENLSLKLNRHHTLEFKNFIVNEGRKFTSVSETRPNEIAFLDSNSQYTRKKDIILSFQQRLLYSGNFGGTHTWTARHGQELDWNLGYTYDLQHVPDQRSSHFISMNKQPYTALGSNTPDRNDIDDVMMGMISRIFVKNEENVYNASLDYTIHLNNQLQFKTGTYQLYKVRNVGRRFFRVNRSGLSPDAGDDANSMQTVTGWQNGVGVNNPSLLNFPLQKLSTIWDPANFPADNTGLALYDATSPTDSYVASEQNNAGYVMGDWKAAHEQVTINAGLRLEFDRQKAASAIPSNIAGGVQLGYANHPLTSWLPSVNISYHPSNTMVLRTGYGRTVNRPEFREISAYQDYNYMDKEIVSGDPATVTAVLDNYDFRTEWYPHNALQNEMFNAGVFYKYIQHPIERLVEDKIASGGGGSDFTNITFGNALSAKVIGVEGEVRKSLSFIGSGRLFKNLSLVANGSWIKSSTIQLSGNSLSGKRDTAKGRPLQGQSPYIVNGGLFYDNAGWGTKIGLIYNVNGPRIYAKSLLNKNFPPNTVASTDTLYDMPDLLQLPFHQLDFSFTQRLIRSLQMKITIQNILDQTSKIVEDHYYNQRYKPESPVYNATYHATYYIGDNIYSRFKPDRYFLLQFTYAF